jgi:hypothetical protein
MWVIPEDLGNFSPKKEKNLGEQKFAHLSVSNFHGRNNAIVYSYTETSGGQSSNLYLNIVHFFNSSVH